MPADPAIAAAFEHVVGQGRALGDLTRALERGRLAHGLLFAGPSGVGKRTAALGLAALLLAERRDDPASVRAARVLIDAGGHPDFHHVTRERVRELPDKDDVKARDFTVDVVREFVVKPALRKALLGGAKVFVLDEIDRMNSGAQNALLKTLEEPFGDTTLVLLTDEPEALLPTVRSRCQTTLFAPLATDDAAKLLSERHAIEPLLSRHAAVLANGSPGLALQLARDEVVPAANELFRLLDAGDAAGLRALLDAETARLADKAQERDPKGSADVFRRDALGLLLRLAGDRLRRALPDADDATRARVADEVDRLVRAERLADANVQFGLVLQTLA